MSGVSFIGSNYGTFNQTQVRNTQDAQATLKTHDAGTAVKDLEGAIHAAEHEHQDSIVLEDSHGKVFTMNVEQAHHLLESMKVDAAHGELDLHHIKISDHESLDDMINGTIGKWLPKIEHYLHDLHLGAEITGQLMSMLKSTHNIGHAIHDFMSHNKFAQATGIATQIYDMVKCAVEMDHYMSNGEPGKAGVYAARFALDLGAIMGTMAGPPGAGVALGCAGASEAIKAFQGEGLFVDMWNWGKKAAEVAGDGINMATRDAEITFHDNGSVYDSNESAHVLRQSNVGFGTPQEAQAFLTSLRTMKGNPIEGQDFAIIKGKDNKYHVAELYNMGGFDINDKKEALTAQRHNSNVYGFMTTEGQFYRFTK